MPILFSQRSFSSYLRIAATILVLGVILNLFFWGAQPIAINLVPAPWDKFLHGITFAILACGIGLASGLQRSRMIIAAFFGAFLIGVLDEWHQIYLPGRHPGWDDLVADGVGSLAGAALLFLRKRSLGEHS
jgi:drug/metabolite transporter (DMT)-like permease